MHVRPTRSSTPGSSTPGSSTPGSSTPGSSTWRPSRAPRSEREPAPLAASLDRMARRLGAPPPDVLSAVFARWEQMVGPQVAAHATPRSLRGGVLVIAVDEPAWATQLRMLSADLLTRLAAAAPDPAAVRELRVVVRR